MAKRKQNSSESSDEEVVVKREPESSSSSTSDDEDVEWNAKETKPKVKAKSRPTKKAKAVTEELSEEREEGEVEDDDEPDDDEDDMEEFNDGYDENLMGDEDDQRRLALMTEKEREQELFNRSEKREVLKTRFEIEKKLRMAKKKELNKSATEAAQRSTERRRNMEDKRKVKDAIKGLKAEREKKKEKMNRQKLKASDVYSDSDSDSDDEKDVRRKSSSSSSSSSTSSDESDAENGKRNHNEESKKDSDDWDERGASDKEEVESWSIALEHLNAIRISRYKMEKWCHSPFFRDTVVGCFVRINIGANTKTNLPVYIVAQVVEVIETPKIYNLGNTRTNKGIKLKHARQPERVYRLEFVSNNEMIAAEFQQWHDSMLADRCEFPSKDFVERKKKDITNAVNYSYSDNDIESIVQEKERFNNRPVNFAMKKTRLLKEKELAEMNGDNDRVEKIMQEIDELECEAKRIDKKRTQNIAAISYINERNRMRNIKEAEKALTEASANLKSPNNFQDPFTRRKCTPTMIHMFNKNKMLDYKEASDLSVKLEKERNLNASKLDSDNSTLGSDFDVSKRDLSPNGESDQKSSIISEKSLSPGSSAIQQNDLFLAHNFDIKIDFDVDIGIPSASSTNSSLSGGLLSTRNHTMSAPKTTNRRSLNLDEYKKMKGLI